MHILRTGKLHVIIKPSSCKNRLIRLHNGKKESINFHLSQNLNNPSDSTILKPLPIIFRNSLNSGIFPGNWKSNIAPVHEKGNKYLIQNYCSLSLLPISSKIFEKSISNTLFKFVAENILFYSKHVSIYFVYKT